MNSADHKAFDTAAILAVVKLNNEALLGLGVDGVITLVLVRAGGDDEVGLMVNAAGVAGADGRIANRMLREAAERATPERLNASRTAQSRGPTQ